MKSADHQNKSHVNHSHYGRPFFNKNPENPFFQPGGSKEKAFFQPSRVGTIAKPVQAKLTIGEVGDKYEQEADQVAAKVVKEINHPSSQQKGEQKSVQRMEDEQEIQTKPILQRQEAIAGGEASTDLESSINRAKGGGQPLDEGLQRSMGSAMNADFSGVRVHTNSRADQLNKSLQAKAFTTDQDVFFGQGEYQPGSQDGQKLIAHELTHVQQQTDGNLVEPKTLRDTQFSKPPTEQQVNTQLRQPRIRDIRGQGAAQVLQRAVVDVHSETIELQAPGQQMMTLLEKNAKLYSPYNLNKARKTYDTSPIFASSRDPKADSISVPTSIEGKMKKISGESSNDIRTSDYSSFVGKLGREEYYINTNQSGLNFEGGHLISHSFFKLTTDANAENLRKEYADKYPNLIPMSHNMNHSSYKNVEERAASIYNDIIEGGVMYYGVDVTRAKDYPLTTRHIEKIFDISPKSPHDNKNHVLGNMKSWLPIKIKPFHKKGTKGDIEEQNSIQEATPTKIAHGTVGNLNDFIEGLHKTTVWTNATDQVKAKVAEKLGFGWK